MRLHVLSLPHTQLTKAYSACAYTQKVRKFADMMTAKGHEVILYAGEHSEAAGELVTCITDKQQAKFGYKGPEDYLKIDFNSDPIWGQFVSNAIREIQNRIKPKDIICLITSEPFRPVMDSFPDNLVVEFGIGYPHTMARFRVFESYAWMHYVYGRGNEDGHDFDAVIPNYFEAVDFPKGKQDGDYYLFIGRVTDKKGYRVAIEVCQKLGKKLIIAGPLSETLELPDDNSIEYVGTVGPEERAKLLGAAKAVFVPTRYVGPFEGVAVEAMMCGTPVITSDFGAFTEYVVNGVNGYRCRSFQDYIDAVEAVEDNRLFPAYDIQRMAQEQFSCEVVADQYDEYFKKLLTLHGDGWYTEG